MDKLAKLLFKNARYSVTDLAAMLDTTEQDIKDRIKKLEADGVINGYRALINWEKLGDKRITAMVELKVTPQPDAGYEELAKKIMQFDEVSDLYLMSGAYDFLVTVKADDLQSAAMFVSHRLAPIEGVTSTTTHFMLRNYKQMGARICYNTKDDRGILSF